MSNLNPDQIATDVKNNKAILLDVRTKDEWDEGHASGAILRSVDDILAGNLDNLPKDKPIYTYCRLGTRAGKATKYLKDRGYIAYNIGGLQDWIEAGGAVENPQ